MDMTARRPGILGLAVPLILLAALAVLLMASETGTLSSLRHGGFGSAPAAAPASGGNPNATQPTSGSGSPTSTTTSGNPTAAVRSGGA